MGWDAVRDAVDRAEEVAQAEYSQITANLEELAAELLDDPGYQRASSPGGRKMAAERFLVPRAGGFATPAVVREELYARAQRLAKTAKQPPTLL